MKPSPETPEQRWSRLIVRARADKPPALAVEPLLTLLHEARPERIGGSWLADLGALLETRRFLTTCSIAAAAIAAVGAWQVVTWVEALEWIEWAYPATGGMS